MGKAEIITRLEGLGSVHKTDLSVRKFLFLSIAEVYAHFSRGFRTMDLDVD